MQAQKQREDSTRAGAPGLAAERFLTSASVTSCSGHGPPAGLEESGQRRTAPMQPSPAASSEQQGGQVAGWEYFLQKLFVFQWRDL